MKAIIFGGTGYIGSHVAEQLAIARHDVTAAVRPSGDTAFLKSLGIPIVEAGLADADSIVKAVSGFEVVYNCTARPRLHQTLDGCREVEVKLTRKLIEGGGKARFSSEDARDIGRAFVWLGELKGAGGQTYNLRAFEVSHLELKKAIDEARGIRAREIYVPRAAAMIAGAFFERITPYSREPMLTRFAARALTTDMLFSDRKLRGTGFNTIYGFKQAVADAVADQESRRMSS